MIRVRTLLYLSLGLAMASSCKKDDTGGGTQTQPGATATATETEAPQARAADARAASEQDQVAERFRSCWQAFSNKNETVFKDCYGENAEFVAVDYMPPRQGQGPEAALAMASVFWQAFPDVKSEPQLVLINGNNVAAIIHTEGTNTGELGSMPATNEKLSMFEAQVLSLTPDRKVAESRHFIDQGVMAHQLGLRESEKAPDAETPWENQIWVMAENNELEKTNLELAKAMRESLSKGDQEAYMRHVAEEVSFRYVGDKEPMDGLESYKQGIEEWNAMADHSAEPVDMWAAGDWVVLVSDVTATMKKNLPGTTNTKGKEVKTTVLEFLAFDQGKLKTHWVFENSMAYPVQLGLIEMPDSPAVKTTRNSR